MINGNITKSISDYIASDLPEILIKHHIPAAAVVVIKNGKVLYKGATGYSDIENKKAADTNTLFAIGSTSKAFTAVMLGQLVDEGKLSWDDLVIDFVPELRTKDPVSTSQLNIRDIMCHRSGLPRHDLVWFLSTFSRKELLSKIRYLEPFAPFRSAFCYNNLMWMVAGIVIERITNNSWEKNLSERIFGPLGMADANSSTEMTAAHSHNYALPYELQEKRLIRIPFHQIDPVGPAGSINANIDDYSKWLLLNINKGQYEGKTILSEESMNEIHAPQMAIDRNNQVVGIINRLKEFSNQVYTLGWVSQHYRGTQLLQHAGGIDGFSAFISFLPDERTGVGVLTNLGGTNIHYGITWDLIDRAMGWEPVAWIDRLSEYEAEMTQKMEAGAAQLKSMQVQGTNPSHSLDAYSGVFSHPAYGKLQIQTVDGKLKGMYNHIPVTFEHFHYDVFLMHFEMVSPRINIPVTFSSDVTGVFKKAYIPLEEMTSEIEFCRENS